MRKIKKSCFLIIFFSIIFLGTNAFAVSEAQSKYIVKNCKRIRETLKGIQRADTSSRTDYLPMVYDTMLGNFIIPMNTRLLKNEQENERLTKNQEEFVKAYSNFKTDFVTYSRSMEELLTIDCENDPESFYSKLEVVRTDRDYVNLDIQKMNRLIEKQKQYVGELRENL